MVQIWSDAEPNLLSMYPLFPLSRARTTWRSHSVPLSLRTSRSPDPGTTSLSTPHFSPVRAAVTLPRAPECPTQLPTTHSSLRRSSPRRVVSLVGHTSGHLVSLTVRHHTLRSHIPRRGGTVHRDVHGPCVVVYSVQGRGCPGHRLTVLCLCLPTEVGTTAYDSFCFVSSRPRPRQTSPQTLSEGTPPGPRPWVHLSSSVTPCRPFSQRVRHNHRNPT